MAKNIPIEGERLKRVGNYDRQRKPGTPRKIHRPIIDPKKKGRYKICDGTKEISVAQLLQTVRKSR